MRIIQFTSPSDEKILNGTKTMTARFWRKTPPRLSEIVRAQTGRKKETTFAYLKVVGLAIWKPFEDTDQDLQDRIGYSKDEIAVMEGYENWDQFLSAYMKLNSHLDSDDPNPKRKHYFIDFQRVDQLEWDI